MSTAITIECADGYPLAATQHDATQPKGIVIIAPAIGVKRSYYSRFADYLANAGYTAITFDYRDTGEQAGTSQQQYQLADWGSKDIEAVITYSQSKSLPLSYVGHSIGGQLLGLAPSAAQLRHITLVGASAPYWQRWPFPQKLTIFAASNILFPLAAQLTRQFPAKQLGLGNQTIPSYLAKTWTQWLAKPDYLFDRTFNLDTSHYKNLTQPMHFIGFSDDTLAPEINIKKLMTFYPNAQTSLEIIAPHSVNSKQIGHTGFFRDTFKANLWLAELNRLQSHLPAGHKP